MSNEYQELVERIAGEIFKDGEELLKTNYWQGKLSYSDIASFLKQLRERWEE